MPYLSPGSGDGQEVNIELEQQTELLESIDNEQKDQGDTLDGISTEQKEQGESLDIIQVEAVDQGLTLDKIDETLTSISTEQIDQGGVQDDQFENQQRIIKLLEYNNELGFRILQQLRLITNEEEDGENRI